MQGLQGYKKFSISFDSKLRLNVGKYFTKLKEFRQIILKKRFYGTDLKKN